MPIGNIMELKASVLNRAATDEIFRNDLVQNPKQSVQNHLSTLDLDPQINTDLDPDLDIHVHIESGNDVHLVVTPVEMGVGY